MWIHFVVRERERELIDALDEIVYFSKNMILLIINLEIQRKKIKKSTTNSNKS